MDNAHTCTHIHAHAHTHTHKRSESSELQVSLYTQKKLIVTEIGTAAQQILTQFERTRDNEEKKRIGSDMTNLAMGNMIRGRFCSAIASLLCDGLKPSRLGGLVQDDIWKVAVAFCHEGGWGLCGHVTVCTCHCL